MDEVFGSVGLAAADQARQDEINKRSGLTAFFEEDDMHEKRDEDSELKMKAEV